MGWTSNLEVTSAAASQDLISLEVFKDDHGITSAATDDLLGRLISRASRAMARACGRTFAVEGLRETIWIDRNVAGSPLAFGQGELVLKRYPVIEVTLLTEGTSELVDGTDFSVNKDCGIALRFDARGLPTLWRGQTTVVEYSAGYATVPGDLQDAASMVVWDRFQSRNQDRAVQSKFVDGVDRVEYFKPSIDAYPPEVQEILDSYRVPVLK